MAVEKFPNKILWLASYPKSGNTWFRAFLTALLNEGEVQINDMETDGIFSSREIFDGITDLDSRYFSDDEVKLMQPDVYRQLAADRKRLSILKVHDAFSSNTAGKTIIPEDVTLCAVYLIRNPLDVVGSFANHNNSSIDAAIKLMCNEHGCLSRQPKNLNTSNQLQQLMYDWSGHARSWAERPAFPVHVVRYEDMLQNGFETFRDIVLKIGWTFTDEEIKKAIAASSFDRLSSQEKEKGFYEKSRVSKVFFRGGKMGNWEKELTQEQIDTIIAKHKTVMEQYGYYTG